MVEVVSSLLQWSPANITLAGSSRLEIEILYGLYLLTMMMLCLSSVLQSFEEVISRYAQQLSLNQNQTITVPSLVIVAELVRLSFLYHNSYAVFAHYFVLQQLLLFKFCTFVHYTEKN